MPVTTFSDEEIQAFANEIKKQLLPALIHELKIKQLPPLLSRKQFMEVADIGPTKCNELFNRDDFPVVRELGYPKVVTEHFFNWLSKNVETEQDINLKYPYQII